MTGYIIQSVEFADETTPKWAPLRKKDDLSSHIKGSIVWLQPMTKPSGVTPPPSYHMQMKEGMLPIAFLNDKWYWLDWSDDERFRGYWVQANLAVMMHGAGLGDITDKACTPQSTKPPTIFEPHAHAESASTGPAETSPISASSLDEPVDTNPEQTEALASELEYNPIFSDIAELLSYEPEQSREHYLPATLPSGMGLGSILVNPTMLRASMGTSNEHAVTTQVAQLITQKIKLDGGLKGRPLDIFTGERTQAQEFMNAFNLFWMANDKNSTMTIPYK